MQSKSDQEYERVGEHVSIFLRKRTWYAYYRLDGKVVRPSLKTESKKQARRKALAIERDLVNGDARQSKRAPLITDVIEQYIAHLRANQRSENTIRKYQFTFKLLLELAVKRGTRRIDQLNLAFVDAYRASRNTYRVKPKKRSGNVESQTENDPQ